MRRLLTIALPSFLTDLGFYLALFTLTHVLESQGASALRVALVFGVYNLAYIVGAPLVGRWSDRHRLPALALGAGIYALSYTFLAWLLRFEGQAPGLALGGESSGALALACYGGMAALALSNSLYWPAFQARLADREAGAAAVEASLRLFNLSWTSGKALGFLVGGLLYARAPGLCLWGVAAAAWTVVACSVYDWRWGDAAAGGARAEEESPEDALEQAARRETARRTTVPQARKRAFLLAGLLANLAVWAAVSTLKGLAPTLAHSWGIDVQQTGFLLAATLGAQGVAFFLLQDGSWPYRGAHLLAATPLACVGLLGLGWASGLGWALPCAVAVGVAQALTYAASAYYSLDYDERRGLRTGIHEAVLAAGGAVPILGGRLADQSGDPLAPLWLALGLGALCACVVGGLLWRAPDAAAAKP